MQIFDSHTDFAESTEVRIVSLAAVGIAADAK